MSEDHLLTPLAYSSNSRKASIYNNRSGGFHQSSITPGKYYKSQHSCSICKVAFSKSPDNPVKRHSCQFCYNAVCNSCSPLTYFTEASGKDERICIECFKLRTKEEIEQQLADDLKRSLDNETELRIAEVSKSRELQDEIEKKNQVITELNEKIEKISKQLEENISEDKENHAKADQAMLELQGLKNENVRLREDCIKVTQENEEIKKKVQAAMRDTKASSCGCFII